VRATRGNLLALLAQGYSLTSAVRRLKIDKRTAHAWLAKR